MSTEHDKLDFKKMLPVFLIVLIDLMGLTIIIPLLPIYASSFGASAATIGLLAAAYPLMQFVGAPLLGNLSDHYGRKPVLVISQLGTFLSLMLLGFASTLPLLFVARALDGLTGGNISTAQAVITDKTNEKTRTAGLGLIGAAFGIGFTIGPVIAFVSLALSDNNYHVPAFVAAAFSLLAFFMTVFMLEESLPPEKRGQHTGGGHQRVFSISAIMEALRKPQIGLLLMLMFIQQVAFGGFEQMLALFTLSRLGLNASGNAMLFVFIGIIIVLVQGKFIGQWSQRFGERKLVYAGLVGMTVGLLMVAATPEQPVSWYDREALQADLNRETNAQRAEETDQIALPDEDNKGWLGIAWLMLAMIPAAVGGGVLRPSLNSMLTQRVTQQEAGRILGISASFVSGANAIGPLLGGILFQAMGASAPFAAGGVLLAGLFVIAWRAITPTPADARSRVQPAT